MQRLLVAAAVSLASASEPFSWADAQNAMHACTNGSRPLIDKYAYLSTRHPLGNALSGWMHVFIYALASGRQPVVGSGVVPRFCGRDGAFSCGVPFVIDARTLGGVRKMVGRNGAPFSDRARAAETPRGWCAAETSRPRTREGAGASSSSCAAPPQEVVAPRRCSCHRRRGGTEPVVIVVTRY